MPTDTAADLVTDIIIPIVIMLGLFIINGIIMVLIMKKRKTVVYDEECYYDELAGTTCTAATAPIAEPEEANGDNDIELQPL